jgi:membrane protein CcdC involved in cytochrome C biogenesis
VAVSYMVFSGLLAAFSNLCMRKSLDKKGSLRAFLIFQLFFTFLIATSLFPLRNQDYTLNSYTLILSAVCGVSLVGVKLMISRALMVGPAALTFATVNSASIVPSILYILEFDWIAFSCPWIILGHLQRGK